MWQGLPDRLKVADERFFASEESILRSHCRCERIGLSRDIQRVRDMLGPAAIGEVLRAHAGLVAFANLLFASTFDRIPDKRTLLILTDPHARIIAIHSTPEVLYASAEQGVCLGASVAERSIGTNAVSLALHEMEPVILRGKQHYCCFLHDWYCVAIPLADVHGTPIGCLDISMSSEAELGEKLALANFLARELSAHGARNSEQRSSLENGIVQNTAVHVPVRLTERQYQVLALFSKGMSYKQIARQLELQSIKTVQEHLDAARAKLGAETRRDCIRRAVELGLLKD